MVSYQNSDTLLDEVYSKKLRSEKSLLFLELDTFCYFYEKLSSWSFCERHCIVGIRHYDKPGRVVDVVSEEIFQNPFQQRNYIFIPFDTDALKLKKHFDRYR